MAIDVSRVVQAALEAATQGPSSNGEAKKPKKSHMSGVRALLLGAGLVTVGRLAAPKGREMLDSLQQKLEEFESDDEHADEEDYEDEPEAEGDEDFDEEEEYEEEPEGEDDEDFDEEEEPEGEGDEDFDEEEDEDEDERPRPRRTTRTRARSRS